MVGRREPGRGGESVIGNGSTHKLKIFSGRANRPLAETIAKHVADLLTTAGAHRVLCLDLHAAQIQGFFNIPVDHLYASKEITVHVRSLGIPKDELVVLSTDEGNVKKSLKYQQALGGQIAVVDKRRASATETKAAHLIGSPVEGKTVVVFDDMISTATSMVNAIEIARKHG